MLIWGQFREKHTFQTNAHLRAIDQKYFLAKFCIVSTKKKSRNMIEKFNITREFKGLKNYQGYQRDGHQVKIRHG